MARLLVSGSHGLIGRRLVEARERAGDVVVPLVRAGQRRAENAVLWEPEAGELDPRAVSGFDAVVHLAGEPVGTRRWTAAKRQAISASRVDGTEVLARALAASPEPPKVLVCASGINFYGDRGAEVLDERSAGGQGFLAEVCRGWEAACAPMRGVGRVVSLRIGPVLSTEGGMLAALLPVFRWGLGGPVGGGRQYVSWISLPDTVRAIEHVLQRPEMEGAVNVVAPEPVEQRVFARVLGAVLRRPAVVPVPGWVVRAVFGQLAEESVLASLRIEPRRLMESGFRFEDGALREALTRAIAKG